MNVKFHDNILSIFSGRAATKSTCQIVGVHIHVERTIEIKRLQGLPGKSVAYSGNAGRSNVDCLWRTLKLAQALGKINITVHCIHTAII